MVNHCYYTTENKMEGNYSTTHNNVNGVDESISDHNPSFGRGGTEAAQVVIKRNPPNKKQGLMNIATWNVRSFNVEGRLENTIREMQRNDIAIMGICETHWEGCHDFTTDGFRVVGSGGNMKRHGVAIILDLKKTGTVSQVEYISDRIMMLKLNAEPVDILIIQVYMPTSTAVEEDVDNIYDQIEGILKENRGKHNTIVMGDFNAVVGANRASKSMGPYGLGTRNPRGQKLVNFAKRNNYILTNTLFNHHKRRRYTWKMPGDQARYQLDYILVKQRYKNGVKNCRAYPGLDVYSDHNPVMMSMRIKLKKIKKQTAKRKWNLDALESEEGLKFINDVEQNLTPSHDNSQDMWNHFKETVIKSAEAHIGFTKRKTPKKPWITDGMIDKMDERRKWKNVNTTEGRRTYNRLNNALRRETDKAKEKWLTEQCEEIEKYEKAGRSDLMYKHAREVGKKYKSNKKSSTNILDSDGKVLKEMNQIKARWKEYFETLYDARNKPTTCCLEDEADVSIDNRGLSILPEETENSMKKLKRRKAPGMDNIPGEMLKCLGPKARTEINRLDNMIFSTGKWPTDFTISRVVALPKKANTKRCEEHRTISLISHCSKILLKTMYERIYAKIDDFINEDQFGFRRKLGTREAIATLRVIYERAIDFGQSVYICFVDYEKAFDRINWQKMMEVLKKCGLDWNERRLIWELYTNQSAVIQVGDDLTDPADIGRGTRQGGILSTIVYNVYSQCMVDEGMQNNNDGIKINGVTHPSIRFADDKAMASNTNAGLQRIMNDLNEAGKRYGMKINISKTKVMRITHLRNKSIKILIDETEIEAVNEFKYLGSVISNDGRCEPEIRKRIAKAKASFAENEIFLSSKTNLPLRKRFLKSVVWSNALYAAETWTMTKPDIRRLEAFELWCWRKMLNVTWSDQVTNEDVLRRIGEERRLISTIRERHKAWIGHILRGDTLLKKTMEGHYNGKFKRGRRREGFLSYLKNGQSYNVLKRRSENRVAWRCWTPS